MVGEVGDLAYFPNGKIHHFSGESITVSDLFHFLGTPNQQIQDYTRDIVNIVSIVGYLH